MAQAVSPALPSWLDPGNARKLAARATRDDVLNAIGHADPGLNEFAALISPAADACLELMADHALQLTRRQFGRTIDLYVPLYLSNHCGNGCRYCGFAADRRQPRYRLSREQVQAELTALRRMGFDDVLLLTGGRCPQADVDYLLACVAGAADLFHAVAVEAFAMSETEYAALRRAGCTGVTLYQETYDPRLYSRLHRWGDKQDYCARLAAPEHALQAGMRSIGIGALLGLGDPAFDTLCLFLHARHLQRHYWRSSVAVSFPRMRPQAGDYRPAHTVSDRFLARLIFAFRIALPGVPLVMSTRERPEFRDGIAGLGISKMSVASRTTVGGYATSADTGHGQFDIADTRDVATFCQALRRKGLMPVFKDADATCR